MRTRTIEVDERGRSCVVAVNGDYVDGVGAFGGGLATGDEVELDDGSVWTASKVYSYIQTGSPGTANFVAVDLVRAEGE